MSFSTRSSLATAAKRHAQAPVFAAPGEARRSLDQVSVEWERALARLEAYVEE
jgi:hypothetical protein